MKKFLIPSLLTLMLMCIVTSGFGMVKTGADRTDAYLPLLQGKRVAMMVNQTSVVMREDGSYKHLVDSLIDLDVDLKFLMCPEHGLKGKIGAGATVGDGHYEKLESLPVYSLYGKQKKPQAEWLSKVDVVVFDVQDVGCRFYTYLSTLFYVLEACGECDKEVIVLDRPNPNDTIDGPMRQDSFKSFVGIVPVPILHGCTLGEMAQMMLGERWIGNKLPRLTVIPCLEWNHGDDYSLPIAPSPNLQNDHAIRLYPSLCLFEGTDVSVGRGTPWPFEVFGQPKLKGQFEFTPRSTEISASPLQMGKLCHGYDLREVTMPKGFHLDYLTKCAKQLGNGWITRKQFFDLLAGTDQLRIMLDKGLSPEKIRATWQQQLHSYRQMRQQYLIYKEN